MDPASQRLALRLVTPGPEFAIGKRYVVLAAKDLGSERDSYMPVIGHYQGFFEVAQDSSGHEYVRGVHTRPVAGVRGRDLVYAGPSDGHGLTEKEFLKELRRLAKEASKDSTPIH